MSLFQELKRRNVFRVAVAYIIVSWLLLQVGDTLGPALLLPEWFQSGVAFVLILGFPLAIIFAWAFELTPEGVKREKDVDRSQSITHVTGQKLNVTIIILLGIAVTYLAVDKFMSGPVPVGEQGNPSIAVLPFENMSDDASNEYFADGITEELLNLLAKIPELDVTSRSSAFQFKGKEIDIPTVAKQLGVGHVLEGSVRKSGVKVRITAQLIDAATDKHMWSNTYDRELTDIFAIQDEIAKEVVDVLQVTLLGEAPKARKTDAEAYALYLEGRHFLDLDNPDDWPRAKGLFEQVLDIDPDYATAWLGKAYAIREMANWGDYDLEDGTELARQWATHAVELQPDLAEGWSFLAHLSLIYDWNWSEGRKLVDKALAIAPTNPGVLGEAGRLEQILGRLQQSRSYFVAALEKDPLSQTRLREAGIVNGWLGDYDQAERYFQKNAKLHPDDVWPGDLVIFRIGQGRVDEAVALTEALSQHTSSVDEAFKYYFCAAYALAAAGRMEEAAAARDWIIADRADALGYQIAEMYALQGDVDKAFEWLDFAYDHRDGGMTYLLVDPWFASLHDDARWRPILARMKLLEYWDAMPGR